jgi:hypothetical protein
MPSKTEGRALSLRRNAPGDSDPTLVSVAFESPDRHAAVAVALRAGGLDAGASALGARRLEPAAEARLDGADLLGLVDARPPDLLLRVVAEAHGVLVVEAEEVARRSMTSGSLSTWAARIGRDASVMRCR